LQFKKDHVDLLASIGNGKPAYELKYVNKGLQSKMIVEEGEFKALLSYHIMF